MKTEASAAGTFFHPLMQRSYPSISIVPVREIIESGARLELPISHEVHKKATSGTKQEQGALEL